MKKPLQSVFKPIFKAVLGVSKWWASLHPLANFAYDLVNNRYMRSGGASTQALSLTGVPSGQPVQGVGMTVGAADDPVVVQGLGDELLADGDTPHDWTANGVTLTDNLDGTTTIASTGGDYNRAFTSGSSEVGQVLHVVAYLKEGTSGKARVNIFDPVLGKGSAIAGPLGSLSSINTALGPMTNIAQVLSAGVWRISFDFAPNAATTDLRVAIGPYTTVVGDDVIAGSLSAKQVLPYPGYNPDSQAYAETLTQVMSNPVFAGTVGARPDSYSNIGPTGVVKVLGPETVGGIDCNPIAIRRLNSSGYEGVKSLPETSLPVGDHLMTYYIRAVSGVTIANSFTLSIGGGTPSILILDDKPALEALIPDVWYRRVKTVTVTSASANVGIMATSGAVGTGYDIALPNLNLNTTQDVETQTERGAFSRILAGDGFASTVFPSAKDLVEGGGFDTQEDVDAWTSRGGGVLSLNSGTLHILNDAGAYAGAFQDMPTAIGKVFTLSGEQVAKGGGATDIDLYAGPQGGTYDQYVSAKTLADGPFFFLATSDLVRTDLRTGHNLAGQWKQFDNISLQEVEPGVVIECVAVCGDTDGQHVFYLDDGALNNLILIRRTSAGTIKLVILVDGAAIMDTASSTAWPDDAAGTFRLELTDTDGGCFAAVFLDDVFVVGSDAFDYPHAINQLALAPVAGVKTIKQVYGK